MFDVREAGRLTCMYKMRRAGGGSGLSLYPQKQLSFKYLYNLYNSVMPDASNINRSEFQTHCL